jgi:hypothetical protein
MFLVVNRFFLLPTIAVSQSDIGPPFFNRAIRYAVLFSPLFERGVRSPQPSRGVLCRPKIS